MMRPQAAQFARRQRLLPMVAGLAQRWGLLLRLLPPVGLAQRRGLLQTREGLAQRWGLLQLRLQRLEDQAGLSQRRPHRKWHPSMCLSLGHP